MQAAGLTEAQAAAAEGFTNIDELRKRIGTRAANSFMESNSDTFPEALDDYITELERRESRGDELAEALLVGARTQQRLDGLLLEVTTTETIDGKTVSSIDREAYRAGRARIMAEMRGELAAFEDVLDRLRKSDNEVDRLTAEYFELFDAAKRRGEGDQPGSLLIDFDRFNALERDFIREHGAEKFALIEANALAAPRGANEIERELRTLRTDLEQAGFWEIDDKAWAEFQSVNTDNDSIQNANGFGDWRKQQAAHFDNLLQARAGVSSRVLAEALSDEFARDDGDIQLYEDIRNEFFREPWIAEHPELTREAMEWKYLGKGEGFDRIIDAGLKEAGIEEPAEPPTTSSRKSDETLEMAELFLGGLSFGQLAIKFGIEGDNAMRTVQSRLRRHFGESPVAVRERSEGAS